MLASTTPNRSSTAVRMKADTLVPDVSRRASLPLAPYQPGRAALVAHKRTTQLGLLPAEHTSAPRNKGFPCHASANEAGSSGNGKDPSLDQYVEVKVDSVRVSQGSSVVFLRVLDAKGLVLPVHIGENESSALLKEINKQKQMRPLTHDLVRNMLFAIGYRVTQMRITDIVNNTYFARIHMARLSGQGVVEETDVDARPSDAINIAVRFGAPMYVKRNIAETATTMLTEAYSTHSESHAEIVRSVREALASFEDPTVMYQLQKELAVKEERFEDAKAIQHCIYQEMTNNQMLRLVVAMEAALADGRYDEAARLRDEYRKISSSVPNEKQA